MVPDVTVLVCPRTRQPLAMMARADAERLMGGRLQALRPIRGGEPEPFGPTDVVLVRADHRRAYPVIDGFPILLAPEILGVAGEVEEIDLKDPRYEEAYREMPFYDRTATDEAAKVALRAERAAQRARDADAMQFPAPRKVWIDFICDGVAQWDAYRHLAPVGGRRVVQIGGKGAHAVKFLLAGAREAWNLSPMLGEARYATALAKASGVDGKLRCVVAIAEELPFADRTFDGILVPSCVHHMQTDRAFPEFRRVLAEGGRFAAIEPWLAPGYKLGTRLIGKREANPYCKPLTKRSASPLFSAFGNGRIIHHGTFTRYALIAVEKTGLPLSATLAWWILKIDDAVASLIPGLRGLGSGAVLLGTR